ncbi:MAG: PilN domain-containing protein [Herbaspirillum sp.]
MLRFNLLPHRRLKRQQRWYRLLYTALATAVMSVLFADMLLNQQLAQQSSLAQRQQKEHDRLDAQLRQLADVQRQLVKLEKQRQTIEALREQQNQPLQLLQTLARATPHSVQLQTLKLQAAHLVLSGTAPDHQDIMQLLANLHRAGGMFALAELQEIRAVHNRGHDFVIAAKRPAVSPTPANPGMEKNRQ